jgi:hypothetical protein
MGKSNSTGTNQDRRAATASEPGQAMLLAIPREQLISEAAYYKAEQRGFQPGSEMADWFEAEADVARMLGEFLG